MEQNKLIISQYTEIRILEKYQIITLFLLKSLGHTPYRKLTPQNVKYHLSNFQACYEYMLWLEGKKIDSTPNSLQK